jgi:tetratricopeptide (TPR) repeat protein
MKSIHFILIFILALVSCKSSDQDASLSDPTARYPLLQRNNAIQYAKEWENVHNTYSKLIHQIRIDPNDKKAHLELAELFMQEARVTGEHGHYYPLALKLANQYADESNADKDYRFRALADKASILMSLHQFTSAKSAAIEAIRINPYNAMVHGALVDALVELGEYKEATAAADKMTSIRPDIRSYSRVSYLRELYGDIPGAIEAMDQAVQSGYPGYEETAWARLKLGELYEKYGKKDVAKKQYQMILAERPNYPFAIAALSKLAFQDKAYAAADSLIDQAISYIPEVSFYIAKAEIKLKQGRTEEANLLSKKILIMLQDDEKAGHTMDLAYAHVYKSLLNDPAKALEYVQKEYAVRPDNIEVNQQLADLYRDMGEVTKSKDYLAKTSIPKI